MSSHCLAAAWTSAAVTFCTRSGQVFRLFDGLTGGQSAAIPARHRCLAVLRIDHVGDQLDLGALEFFVGDALVGDFLDHRVHRLFEILQRHVVARRAVDAKARPVERRALIPGTDRGRERLLDHQLRIEPAVGAGAENLRQDFKRFGFAGLAGCRGRHEIASLQARLRHARIGKGDGSHRALLRLLRTHARADFGARRDLAVGFLGELLDFVGGDVARDHQHRIIGRVPLIVEIDRILAIQLLDLMTPADHRTAIRMIEIQARPGVPRRASRPGLLATRLFCSSSTTLQFRPHRLVGQLQAGHAIGLELHHHLAAGRALRAGNSRYSRSR